MSLVPALPTTTQTTFGGGPKSIARWRKSSSFETMTKPCSRACCQMSSSLAPSRFRLRGCALPVQSAPASGPADGRGFRQKEISRHRRGQSTFARGRKRQHRQNVLMRQVREILKQLRFRISASQVLQHVVDRDSSAGDAGLAGPDPRINGDSVLQIHLRPHDSRVLSKCSAGSMPSVSTRGGRFWRRFPVPQEKRRQNRGFLSTIRSRPPMYYAPRAAGAPVARAASTRKTLI